MFIAISEGPDPDFAPGARVGGHLVSASEPAIALGESWQRRLATLPAVMVIDLLESWVVQASDLEGCLAQKHPLEVAAKGNGVLATTTEPHLAFREDTPQTCLNDVWVVGRAFDAEYSD